MRTPHAITVVLQPSWLLAWAIVAWYAAAAAIAWTLPWSAPWALLASFTAAALASVEILRTALRRGRGAWKEVRIQEDRAIRVRLADGTLLTGRLAPTTYVGSSLVALHVRAEGSRRLRTTFVIARMTGDEQFRRLKVLLRLSFAPARAKAGEALPVRAARPTARRGVRGYALSRMADPAAAVPEGAVAAPARPERDLRAGACRRYARASHSLASTSGLGLRLPADVADTSSSR